MPSNVQLVPKFTFPHEETHINDNTGGAYDEIVSNTITYPYISVFAGPKGIDGHLVKINSRKKYYETFGKTNFKKYGQPHLMPEAILGQSNTEVWCMRVMPEDALYANSILSAWYKTDVENKAFYIKFTTKNVTVNDPVQGDYHSIKEILHNREAIEEYGALLDGAAVDGAYTDAEGFTQIPLATFTAPGRGAYGQNLRWRIIPDEEYENENGFKVYKFQIIDTETSATLLNPKTGSIVSSAKTADTIFINDVIADMDLQDIPAYITFYEDNVEVLYNAYRAFIDEVLEANPTEVITIPELDEFDPFFGKAVKKPKVRVTPDEPYIKFVKQLTADVDQTADDFDANLWSETELADVSSVIGNKFFGGSDGAFASDDIEVKNKAVDDAYIKAFNGGYDKTILAPKRIRSLALFDANYSMPVKLALAKLAMHRNSAPCYLDTELRELVSSVEIGVAEGDYDVLYEIAADFDNFEEPWCISVNTHNYFAKELCTGRRITVTTTYYLAATDANFRASFGTTYPHIGEAARLSGHIKNSLKPCIAENEEDLKQALYDARFNYFEDKGDNVFERGTMSMYVKNNSDLLEESNVIALYELKEAVEEDVARNRYFITTPTKRKEFKNYLDETYGWMEGTYFDSLDFKYLSNKYESQRNIVHLYIAVTFPRRSKITLIEIDVNRAEYQPDLSDEDE